MGLPVVLRDHLLQRRVHHRDVVDRTPIQDSVEHRPDRGPAGVHRQPQQAVVVLQDRDPVEVQHRRGAFQTDVDELGGQQIPAQGRDTVVVDHPAGVDHHHPLRDVLDVGHVVRGEEHGGPDLLVQVYQELAQTLPRTVHAFSAVRGMAPASAQTLEQVTGTATTALSRTSG
jgi:hypothetical protein